MSEDVKLFFLVAGLDNHHPDAPLTKGLDFPMQCRFRMYQIIRYLERHKGDPSPPGGLKPPTRLLFIFFDVGEGEIKAFEWVLAAGSMKAVREKNNPWVPLTSIKINGTQDLTTIVKPRPNGYRRLTEADYSEGAFDEKKAKDLDKIMSVVDIYEAVRSAPAGSVLELSIFSHGWPVGPVIVNSFELPKNKPADEKLRYKDDFDGRSRVDFLENMGEKLGENRLEKFKKAFARKSHDPGEEKADTIGVFRLWGCGVDEVEGTEFCPAKDLIDKISAEVKKRARVTDETELTIRYKGRDLKTHPPLTHPLGSWLRLLIEKEVLQAYAYVAAKNAKLTVVSTVPGIGTEPDADHIQEVNPDRMKYVNFYRKYLSIDYDPKGRFFGTDKDKNRHYGIFNQAALDRIAELLNKPAIEGV